MRRLQIPHEELVQQVDAALSQARSSAQWTRYDCILQTPMYGGGVKAGEVDELVPVRAPAIRGQLRFWWRIACGPFASSREMFQRESALWGGISRDGPTASLVSVRVSTQGRPKLEPAFTYPPNPNKPGEKKSFPKAADWASDYALFSAQGKLAQDRRNTEIAPNKMAQPGLKFELAIQIAERASEGQRQEVQQALRWWASFGGLGARTRRGLGAVEVKNIDLVTAEEVEGKGGRLALRSSSRDASHAWKEAINRLKAFRQGRNIGRNPPADGSKSPAGRSLWPEADSIREFSGRKSKQHATPLVQARVYPRAAFGLPIVFHFKDEKAGDPRDHILEPAGNFERMASPLILRPYFKDGKWHPMALLLPGWGQALRQPLKFRNINHHQPAHWPDSTEQRRQMSQQIRPMRQRGDDPLSAFMNFFTE